MKKKKIISLICMLCMISTIVALPGIGITGYAAAADVESYLNTARSYSPTSMGTKPGSNNISSHSAATFTGSGNIPSDQLGGEGNPDGYTITGNGANSVSRIALRSIGVGSKYDANTAKILHVGWTMANESGISIDLTYQVFTTSETNLAVWNDDGTCLSSSGSTINLPQSYHADWFIDCEKSTWRLYINNIMFSEGSLVSDSTTLRNLYFKAKTAGSYTYSITDQVFMTYKSGTTMEDVVAYTLAGRNNSNYYWSVSGINTIDGVASYRIVGNPSSCNSGSGAVDGANYVITASSSNENSGVGYRLRMLNSNGTNTTKGCLPQDSENDNIIHQSLTITPNLSSGNTAAVGFRGNNTYQIEKYKFGEENGYESGKGYRFDILVNNKDKEYYILVNGEKCATGKAGNGYLAEFVYTIANAGSDTLFLSDIITTSYDYTVSMEEALSFISTKEELSIKDLTVLYDENSGYEISACAVFSNISQDFNSPKLIYTLYKNGALFDVDGENITEEIETTNDMVKLKYSNINRKYPYCLLKVDGGEVNSRDILTVKAYFVDNEITQLVSDEASFTIE